MPVVQTCVHPQPSVRAKAEPRRSPAVTRGHTHSPTESVSVSSSTSRPGAGRSPALDHEEVHMMKSVTVRHPASSPARQAHGNPRLVGVQVCNAAVVDLVCRQALQWPGGRDE